MGSIQYFRLPISSDPMIEFLPGKSQHSELHPLQISREENGFYACWALWHYCSGSDLQCLSKSRYCIPNFPYLHADKINVSAERSFSQLKRINFKNPYVEQRWDWVRKQRWVRRDWTLSLLCIEADILRSVDFDDVIKASALAKSRKRTFWIVDCIVNVCKICTGLVSV